MASGVENRVVSMTFDNAAFEQRISQTIKSLENLNKGLDTTKAVSGLSELSKAGNNFSLGGMSSAVDGISAKFLALSTVGITALSTLTSKAISVGTNIVKSFSLAPVMDGFQEYEVNMNSIQTILANTSAQGTNLEQVTAALDQLNEYSDRTIYNFSEMAKNIGTFTAAGVDLDTSVSAIKGIANLSAISGSSSLQASSAMYQLSQAISTGTLRLQDWNSVTNAGIGGKIFQKALFETGKSLKTLPDIPIDMTFEQWEEAGNNFRGSLEENWLTAEVLTNTLQGFTGDLDAAQLKALGYTEEQAQEMMRLGKLGNDAATEVKTLTQLLGVVKESVASGWSESFRIVFGTFEEAKALFTGINTVISGFVGTSAAARNELLQGWKDIGGREILLEGLADGFKALVNILKPVQEAFRTVFPKMTSIQLALITKAFSNFTEKLNPSKETILQIKTIFTGLFSALSMGFEIVKGVVGVFRDLFDALIPDDGTGTLAFLASIGQFFTDLRAQTAEGNVIPEFFENISSKIVPLVGYLRIFIETAKDVFRTLVETFSEASIPGMEVISGLLERLTQRFGALASSGDALSGFAQKTANALEPVKDTLNSVWVYIKNWFKELGTRIANAFGPGDFDNVVDVVNVGLLGGIVALLTKFVKTGFKFDFGEGLLKNISGSFEQLTGTLSAMQTSIKADALLKIAIAIGVLTASVVVLSLIDSAALTKALTAMAIGFGQLIGSFAALNAIASGTGAAKLPLLAAALILLASAILILSIAMKILATMSWEEIAKGLGAISVLLFGLSKAVDVMTKNTGGLFAVGAGLVLVAVAMNLLAVAMKIFATMSWEEIAKGLVSVGVSLATIGIIMKKLMPQTLLATAAGLVLVGVALNLIAASMLIFGTMSWEEIAKGLVAMAGSLALIGVIMKKLMPKTLIATAAGLVLVGVALNLIAASMLIFGAMSWEQIAKGLVAMGGALLIIALAARAMEWALPGAVAITVVAGALIILTQVMKELSKLSLTEIGMALLAIAGVFAVIGISAWALSPVIGTIFILGIALTALGVAFSLFGVAALAFAKAFDIVVKSGEAGVKFIQALLEHFITISPRLATALAESLIEFTMVILKAAPVLIESLGIVIDQLLKTVIELAPRFAEAMIVLVEEMLTYIQTIYPQLLDTGILIVLTLLQGIRDNIYQITTMVATIITEFLNALTDKIPDIINSATDLIVAFIEGITNNLGLIVTAATDLVVEFITAVGGAYLTIIAAGAKLIGDIIIGIGQAAEDIVTAGANAIISFLAGVASNILLVIDAGFQIVIDFLNGLADSIEKNRGELASAGFNLLDAIFGGILSRAVDVIAWFTSLPRKIIGWIGDTLSTLAFTGYKLILGLWNGISERVEAVITWFKDLGGAILGWIGDGLTFLVEAGKDIIEGLWNGIYDKATNWLKGKLGWLSDLLPGWVKDALGISSPSKVFAEIGENIVAGLVVGIEGMDGVIKTSVRSLSNQITDNFNPEEENLVVKLSTAINKALDSLQSSNEFNPVITPVIDLSEATRSARIFGDILSFNDLSASLSYGQARTISTAENQRKISETPDTTSTKDISFSQVINSPTALSTNDIYRQTRSQIALAKQELSIL